MTGNRCMSGVLFSRLRCHVAILRFANDVSVRACVRTHRLRQSLQLQVRKAAIQCCRPLTGRYTALHLVRPSATLRTQVDDCCTPTCIGRLALSASAATVQTHRLPRVPLLAGSQRVGSPGLCSCSLYVIGQSTAFCCYVYIQVAFLLASLEPAEDPWKTRRLVSFLTQWIQFSSDHQPAPGEDVDSDSVKDDDWRRWTPKDSHDDHDNIDAASVRQSSKSRHHENERRRNSVIDHKSIDHKIDGCHSAGTRWLRIGRVSTPDSGRGQRGQVHQGPREERDAGSQR